MDNEKIINENENNLKEENKKNKKVKNFNIFLRIKWLLFGIIVGIIFSIVSYDKIKTTINKKIINENIDIEYLTGTIRNMSDLITSELEYTGIVEYKTHEGEFFNFLIGEEFLMMYNAEIKAGIDLTEVVLSKEDDKILVYMPHATLKYKKVKPDSIKFYDTKKALIKSDGKQLGMQAQIEAENDIDKNVNIEKLLQNAEEQAKRVIEGLIKEISGDFLIVFNISDNNKENEISE